MHGDHVRSAVDLVLCQPGELPGLSLARQKPRGGTLFISTTPFGESNQEDRSKMTATPLPVTEPRSLTRADHLRRGQPHPTSSAWPGWSQWMHSAVEPPIGDLVHGLDEVAELAIPYARPRRGLCRGVHTPGHGPRARVRVWLLSSLAVDLAA